jgi:hypothetical protein
VSASARLATLSVLVALGAVATYVLLFRVAIILVLDRDGVVRWFSVSRNFQVRPDPGDVLRAVRSL